ncbi:unnamed protein product [Ectocarpus fasciculatus]
MRHPQVDSESSCPLPSVTKRTLLQSLRGLDPATVRREPSQPGLRAGAPAAVQGGARASRKPHYGGGGYRGGDRDGSETPRARTAPRTRGRVGLRVVGNAVQGDGGGLAGCRRRLARRLLHQRSRLADYCGGGGSPAAFLLLLLLAAATNTGVAATAAGFSPSRLLLPPQPPAPLPLLLFPFPSPSGTESVPDEDVRTSREFMSESAVAGPRAEPEVPPTDGTGVPTAPPAALSSAKPLLP